MVGAWVWLKLGLSTYLVTQIILSSRNRGKL